MRSRSWKNKMAAGRPPAAEMEPHPSPPGAAFSLKEGPAPPCCSARPASLLLRGCTVRFARVHWSEPMLWVYVCSDCPPRLIVLSLCLCGSVLLSLPAPPGGDLHMCAVPIHAQL